ncbi:MAG: hypothetical protein IK997_01035 [Bacilli bacterium]|nr:hypothetical protein [Bacilli bacterium]
MMKYLKNHIRLIIVLVIFIGLVFGCFIAYNTIFVNNQSKYGSRLDGIDEVKIDDNKKKEIKENIESLQITKSISIRLSGKTINVMITVNDDIELDKAKETAGKILEKLSDEEKKFYDVQIFVSKDTDDAKYPILGYKHHSKDYVNWTKDR